MDHEEEFLNTFFAQVAQLCTDKAKELVVSCIYIYILYLLYIIYFYFLILKKSLTIN